MIEDGLFLALGFCVAVVLALALLPLLWARALRLTKQRLELLVPWSKGEIDAERDGLRAQAAVEQRRLEQEAKRSGELLAARDVELGRRTVELVKGEIDREALRRERQALMGEIAAQARALADTEGQRFAAEKALHDADRRIETDAVAAKAQAERYDGLADLAEQRRGSIAALETRVAGLTARVEDRDDALLRLGAAVAEAKTSREGLLTERDALAADHADLHRRHEETLQALAAERTEAASRDARLGSRTDALAVAEARITEQDRSMKHKDERFAALQARFDALAADLAARDGAGHGGPERDATLRAAIVAAGDDALHLLAPAPEAKTDELAADTLVRERS